MGLRGSIDASVLMTRLQSGTVALKSDAEATVLAAAGALEVTPETFRNLIRNLAEDPQVNLTWRLWFAQEADFLLNIKASDVSA